MNFKRILIEKKNQYNATRNVLLKEFREYLGVDLEDLRFINVYDLVKGTEEDYKYIKEEILFDENVDYCYEDSLVEREGETYFRVEFVKGQFNQREDSLESLIRVGLKKDGIGVKNSRIIGLKGLSKAEVERVKSYYINPVEMKEIGLEDFTYREEEATDETTEWIDGFIDFTSEDMMKFKEDSGLGLDLEDLEFCQEYFKKVKRDPSITELMLIDTYWSDHCRHTTFMTELTDISFEDGKYKDLIEGAFKEYLESRDFISRKKPICLMDLATINTKELKAKGLLDDLEESEEINAASIEIDIEVDGREEKWLLMFKNETHNHPTEIEPFGGASTCLGGAIRDPLSGRSYVYQAMRITGAADPRQAFDETLKGKLPQRKITREAYKGYSSYGNEIGVPTGYVRELYDDRYVAKRMEVGALVAAAPRENVKRESPVAGDKIVLVGGRTGRDGVGGAVGSSKGHTEDSVKDGGAEVQKGNPSLERKILRLFRKDHVAKMIKKCNDFGAGGVSVAIGELADGLKIDLDRVPVKYEGMSGTEIALSESQERMAVVLDSDDLDKFLWECQVEDLEASVVAEVTEEKLLLINFKGQDIVRIDREFLDTNGIRKKAQIIVESPENFEYFKGVESLGNVREAWLSNVSDLNVASQKGLVEKFDSTVGSGTVLMPMGGSYQLTSQEGMVAKLPVLNGKTDDCSIMTYGFDPKIGQISPFHGGLYSVIEAVTKNVALGCDYRKIRFSFQEYFERLGDDKRKWGKPFAALLGAFLADKKLDLPSIGGKDSMSGTFEDIDVPPTLIAFAVNHDKVDNIVSAEFKTIGSKVIILESEIDSMGMIDFEALKSNFLGFKDLVNKDQVFSSSSVKYGGISRTITEMALGNKVGFEFDGREDLFTAKYGSIIAEVSEDADLSALNYRLLGKTIEEEKIVYGNESIDLDEILVQYMGVLEEVFPVTERVETEKLEEASYDYYRREKKLADPKVLIPIFTGTFGEYDLGDKFSRVGGQVEYFVFKTLTPELIEKSYLEFAEKIDGTDILAFPDGAILGDEPEGGGKLVKNVLEDTKIKESVEALLARDGLVLGIGEGMKALVRSGLLPFGKIVDRNSEISIVENFHGDHVTSLETARVLSNNSPWFMHKKVGDLELLPIASSEARIVVSEEVLGRLLDNGQILSQFERSLTGDSYGLEAIASPCGKVLGRIASVDRLDSGIYKNVADLEMDNIFQAAIDYFNK